MNILVRIYHKLLGIKKNRKVIPYLEDKSKMGYWFDKCLGSVDTRVLQIGSNDGKSGDPFFPLFQKYEHWRGVLVEPIPYIYEKLKQNYDNDPRHIYLNYAISDNEGLPFYWLDNEISKVYDDLPYWYDQLGSFDPAHIIKNLGERARPYIRESTVSCMTLVDLINQESLQDLDILHIDTEGHDWSVLSMLDLSQCQPKFIIYEYNHLSTPDFSASKMFLDKQYVLFNLGIDILAINKRIGDKVINEIKQYLVHEKMTP